MDPKAFFTSVAEAKKECRKVIPLVGKEKIVKVLRGPIQKIRDVLRKYEAPKNSKFRVEWVLTLTGKNGKCKVRFEIKTLARVRPK